MTYRTGRAGRHETGPFDCMELARLYPFAGGAIIRLVYGHRSGNGAEDLGKALRLLSDASMGEFTPYADLNDLHDYGYRCALAMAGRAGAAIPLFEAGYVASGTSPVVPNLLRACRMLRVLQHADWQDLAPFWKGMWEIAHGYSSGLTRARHALEHRIRLMESDYTDGELELLDGWASTPEAAWRLKARGMIGPTAEREE